MTFRPPFDCEIGQGDRALAVTYLTPGRFAAKPQIGISLTQEWRSFLRWLTWPSFADDKRAHGAWCPCALVGGAVKGGRGPVSLLVADVDECSPGALDHSAKMLAPFAGAVVPTFSATLEHPKHRIVLLPSRSFTPDEFPLAWAKMQSTLAERGITLDRGCRNINRLYFACCSPSPERWAELGGARLLLGDPVPIEPMLAAARADLEAEMAERARRPPPRPVREEHRDRYVRAAIDRARANIAAAGEGGRHDCLLREAYSLARFGLSEDQIADALLESFVAVAGEHRRREGERAIHDAVADRGEGGAA